MKDNQPSYELDDGDLTDEQIKNIRDYISQNHPEISSFTSVRSLFGDTAEIDQTQSEKPDTDKKLKEHSARSKESLEWDAMIMKDMKRMYEDEEYRLEIAKNLS